MQADVVDAGISAGALLRMPDILSQAFHGPCIDLIFFSLFTCQCLSGNCVCNAHMLISPSLCSYPTDT